MKISEGKKITLVLNEVEVNIIISALGREQQLCWDSKRNSKPVGWLIDKIYRSMGIKL